MPTSKKTTNKVSKKETAKRPATKKVAKKAVAKKPATKKAAAKSPATKNASKKSSSKKPLKKATDQESFWVTNGMILNYLLTLAAALEVIEKDAFAYHVGKDRNDFADWVETVLEDAVCAAALRKTKTPKAAKTVVIKHIKTYQL